MISPWQLTFLQARKTYTTTAENGRGSVLMSAAYGESDAIFSKIVGLLDGEVGYMMDPEACYGIGGSPVFLAPLAAVGELDTFILLKLQREKMTNKNDDCSILCTRQPGLLDYPTRISMSGSTGSTRKIRA